jgi:hypothetical protein
VGATAAAGAANATLAGSQTAVATTAGPASGGISAFGKALGSFGKSAMSAIPILIVLALSILAITPALKIVGDVIISVAQVIGGVLMKALEMLPAIISSISVGITSIIDTITNSLIKLSAIDASSFLGLAAGILAIGGAMAAIGVMLPAIIAGVGSLFLLNSVLPTFASGLSQLSSVDGNALVSLGMGLITLGGAIGALGLLLPAIIVGVAALGVLSLVLPSLATALTSLSSIDGENLSLIGDGLFKIGQASLMIGAGIAMATIALIGLVPALPILYLVTTAFSAFGTAMLFAGIGSGMLAQSLPIISQSIQQMVEYVDGIYAISDAILKLSTSLSALSFASILAAPAMLAISLFGKQTAEAAPKEGEGGEVESFSILEQAIRETNEMLISEIRGLRDDLNSGKISVNMDGDSVTSKIVRNINRSATNMYGLKG